jgi:hypothetical protein
MNSKIPVTSLCVVNGFADPIALAPLFAGDALT